MASVAGLRPSRGSFRVPLTVAGGRRYHAPLVRARGVTIGAYTVVDIDLPVYDIVPPDWRADGVLGVDVLRFFRISIDRESGQLTLDR
jgi:hypothetical protein